MKNKAGRNSFFLAAKKWIGVELLYHHQKDSLDWKNLVRDPVYTMGLKRLKALLPAKRKPESPKG